MFAGEKNASGYRKFLAESAREEKYKGNVKRLIEDAVDLLAESNAAAVNKVHD